VITSCTSTNGSHFSVNIISWTTCYLAPRTSAHHCSWIPCLRCHA
jgi:hypothetical protein